MAPGNRVDKNRPACCGAVEDFIQARHREEHKRKMSRAKSLINNTRSVREDNRLQASRVNVKNNQVQDDRFAAIEKENMRLLMRMQEIDNHSKAERSRANRVAGAECGAGMAGGEFGAGKAAARIVLGMPPQQVPREQAPAQPRMPRCTSLPAMGRGSNGDARMREMRRIDDENRKLLTRLNGAKPTVKVNKLEEQHNAQQKVMRMRRQNGPKEPQSRFPLPFQLDLDAAPAEEEVDYDLQRIEGLHAGLQQQWEEMQEQEQTGSGEVTPLPAASPRSVASDAAVDPDTTAAVGEIEEHAYDELSVARDFGGGVGHGGAERRDFIAGAMPEHSRSMVEKMMEEYNGERPNSSGPLPAEEGLFRVEDDRDAVAKMLAAADALEVQTYDPCSDGAEFLSYANVVQRTRASVLSSLEVSDQMLVNAQRR